MTVEKPLSGYAHQHGTLIACIFDVDGVLLASPHEQAWREALVGFANPDQFTSQFYQAYVAGKPRLAGALAALEALHVPDAGARADSYAALKQKRLVNLIDDGAVAAYPDALRLVQNIHALGWPMAVASSSKNANGMLRAIRLDSGVSLLDIFMSNVCGRDLPRGKPDPEIFLLAAAGLHIAPSHCLVVEDATAGVIAARKGHMASLGVARHCDAALLRAADADLVVTSLDDVSIDGLRAGRLSGKST